MKRKKFSLDDMKAFQEKLLYDVKFAYVRTGHAKNELLGFLTVFNAKRSVNVDVTRFVRYAPDNERLYLNIYQRKDRDPEIKAPVFVYIHGGGWIGGLPETREAFNTRIAEAGYFVVSLYYGHSPFYPHPEPIRNIYKAFAWLKQHAEEYNIDTDAIFVGGESAGAHLSAMAGAISSDPEYNARFDLDPVSRHQKIAGLVLNCGVFDLEKAIGLPFRNIELYVQSYCGGKPFDELTELAHIPRHQGFPAHIRHLGAVRRPRHTHFRPRGKTALPGRGGGTLSRHGQTRGARLCGGASPAHLPRSDVRHTRLFAQTHPRGIVASHKTQTQKNRHKKAAEIKCSFDSHAYLFGVCLIPTYTYSGRV